MFASRLRLVLLGLALVLSGFSTGRAESPNVRLAVVALPGEQSVPPVLVDLVELQLADAEHLTLLERTHIDAVLEERGRTQALGAEAFVELGALLRADALLLLTAEDRAGADIVIRFRLLDARDGLKLADGTALLPSAAGAYDAVAATVTGRTVRGLASRTSDEAATPIAVLGFASENVSRRFDWVAGVLAAGLEEQLVGCAGLVVLERERLQALVDEDAVTSSLPARLRSSAVFVDGTLRIGGAQGAERVHASLRCRRAGTPLGTMELSGSLASLSGLASSAANAVIACTGSSPRTPGIRVVDEIALLLDEVQARRRLQDHERALRMLEGAHALDPERLDLRFLLLEVGTEAFRREMTRRGRRTNEERQAFYARTVPAAFRRIALAERIVANDLPHGLHAKYRIFGWGDPKRSYLVPGIFDLFSLPRLHDGPAGAGEDVQGDLIEALRRLHARYRAAVRGKNDHVMASILASATKSFPMLIAPGEDPVAYAVGVREEAAALMRRIALPEGPTGLSCGDRLLDADDETGAGMRQILLAHAEPLLRFTGLCALAKRAKEDAERADRARAALAFLRDPAIAKVPAPGSYPWYRRYVVDLVRLLPDEAERRGIVADLLGERPPDTPEPSSAPNSRYALVEVLPFDPAFDGRRLLGEEGVLALLGTRRDGGGHSLCLHRLDADGRKVITTQGFTLQGDAPRGKLAVAARADGTVLVGHADLGLVLFPAEGEAGVLRPSVAEGSAPIRAVAAAGGKVYVLVGGPHDASGLVEIDPADGRERLLLSSRSREPRSPLDGRPLRALCSYPGGAGLLVEAGPRLVPRPADPGDLRDGSTFYGFEPEVDRVVPVLGRRDLGLLGEGTFIALRRAGTRALVEALPVVLDLDLESGAYDVLYAVPTTRRVARLPTRWRGPDWPSPISRVGSDLMCRQGRRLVLFVDGEPKSVPFWSRVKLPERSAEPPAVRDALPRPDGALLLAPSRLYRLERVEVR